MRITVQISKAEIELAIRDWLCKKGVPEGMAMTAKLEAVISINSVLLAMKVDIEADHFTEGPYR
jgi:hypothetical protein